jgi:hypothetical protein
LVAQRAQWRNGGNLITYGPLYITCEPHGVVFRTFQRQLTLLASYLKSWREQSAVSISLHNEHNNLVQ